MESFVLDGIRENHLPGIILRLRGLYSPVDYQTGMLLKTIQNNKFKNIGKGEQYRSIIHIDDAANAFVKAVEHHEVILGKVFNIVDDEPVRANELVTFIAGILNAKQPGSIPALLAKLLYGSDPVKFLLVSSCVKNTAAKSNLKWNPSFPTYREGYKSVIDIWKESNK